MSDQSSVKIHRVHLSFFLLGGCYLLYKFLKYCAYGFDLTDEGFYWNFISNPFAYKWTATQFGYFYHPFYLVMGKSVVGLRRLSFIFSLVLALLILLEVFKNHLESLFQHRVARIGVMLVLGLSVVQAHMLFGRWLTTPSYNTLCFQGILTTVLGCFWAKNIEKVKMLTGWCLVGTGGWMVFLAKPTSAVALALVVFLLIFLSRSYRKSYILLAGVTSVLLLLMTAFWLDGGVSSFLLRLQKSMEFAKIFRDVDFSSSLRMDRLVMPAREKWLMVGFISTVILFSVPTLFKWKFQERVLNSLMAGLIILPLSSVFFDNFLGMTFNRSIGLIPWAIPFGLILVSLLARLKKESLNFDRDRLLFIVFFLSLPFVYVFGSGANYWLGSWATRFIWILISIHLILILPRHLQPWNIFLVSVCSLLFTSTHINLGLDHAYRQGNLLGETQTTQLAGSKIHHTKKFKTYLDYYAGVALEYGTAGVDVMDLSGRSPGTVFALKAVSPGQPWMIGGYKGSLPLAREALKTVSCERIAGMWVLTEPNAKRAFDPLFLSELGLDLERDFEPVAKQLRPVKGCRGPCDQTLYKPNDNFEERLESCSQARKASAG